MQYDIFISYRRNKTADKAEHLLSLLSSSGYKGKVSFDKDNFTGRFDLEILKRVDLCKDFIIILSKDTFAYLTEENRDTPLLKQIADCAPEAFPELEKRLESSDFVRIELARAIKKGKNIIPVVPADTAGYSFSKLCLPEDIASLTRYQAVYYSDNDNCFLFQDIIPKVVAKLTTRASRTSGKAVSRFPLWAAVLAVCILFSLYLVISDWTVFRSSTTLAQLEEYSAKTTFPTLFKTKAAASIRRIKELERELSTIPYFPDAAFSEDITLRKAAAIVKIAGKMLPVPGGPFVMGTDDTSASIKSRPAHPETARKLLLGKYEVSEDEWFAIMADSDGRVDYPMAGVTWHEAVAFCSELEKLSGIPFTLPFERDWEFAAAYGGNTRYAGSDNPDAVAWYAGNNGQNGTPHIRNDKKGDLLCNELELYDMSGNVSEWCADSFALYGQAPEDTSVKVIRGGSVADGEKKIRITYRDPMDAGSSSSYVGIRLAVYL